MKKAQFFLAALLVVMLMTVVGCGTNTNWPDRSDNGINGTGNGINDGVLNNGNGYNSNNGYNGTNGYNTNGGYNNNGYNYTTNNGITNTNNR